MESSLLTQIFDFYVPNAKFACTWVDKGSLWVSSPSGLLMKLTKEQDSPVVSYKGRPVLDKLVQDPSIAYPENRFMDLQELPGSFTDFVSAGETLLSINGSVEIPVPVKIPVKHYEMLCKLIETSWNKFDKAVIGCDKRFNIPVLKLSVGDEVLWLAYASQSTPEYLKVETATASYSWGAWNDMKKCYEKVRKENKMNLNVNTSKLVNDILGVPPKDLKVDPSKAGKDIKVEAVEKPVEAPVKAQEAPKEEQEAPKEVAQEAPVKRTRKKADTTPVTDLTKVIDQLGGAVPEGLSAEEAQQAIRQLRDLMQKAASRMANISLKYIEGTEGAVAKLAAIKAAL